MGLLSSFSLLHGARAASGIDIDPTIIQSARLIAEALDVSPAFSRLDLASMEDWESQLPPADIVAAMSLIHWLKPEVQTRVLAFLGRHQELLYEGHDSLAIETQRLRSVGFNSIEVLSSTERGRLLLYARKS